MDLSHDPAGVQENTLSTRNESSTERDDKNVARDDAKRQGLYSILGLERIGQYLVRE